MAVTTQDSTQYGYRASISGYALQEMLDAGAKLRVQKIDFAQSGIGDANSLVNLWKTPPGKVNIICALSQLYISALGAARTLSIGNTAYTDNEGNAVAADPNGLLDAEDVSAAVLFKLGVGVVQVVQYDSQEGVVIQGIVEVDTIPDAATINGIIVYTMGD